MWIERAPREPPAIQARLDIGDPILADVKVSPPEHYRDVFLLLGAENVISETLANRMALLAGLRNILVHDDLEVDLEHLYDRVQSQLEDFEKSAQQIGNFLLTNSE